MAIAYTNSTNWDNASASSHTISLDITGGNFVAAWVGFGSSPTASSATYAGDSLTEYGTERSTGLLSCWAGASDSWSGTNNLVVTPTASAVSGGVVAAYSGVDSTTPVDHAATEDEATATIHSEDFTTTNNNSLMIQGMTMDCGGGCAGEFSGNAGTGQTERQVLNATNLGQHYLLSDELQPTAGAETLTWSWTTSRASYGITIEVNEAAAAATFTPKAIMF